MQKESPQEIEEKTHIISQGIVHTDSESDNFTDKLDQVDG